MWTPHFFLGYILVSSFCVQNNHGVHAYWPVVIVVTRADILGGNDDGIAMCLCA